MFLGTLSYQDVNIEAVTQRGSVKKVFLEIFQSSQENTCAIVSFLIKLFFSCLFNHSSRDTETRENYD